MAHGILHANMMANIGSDLAEVVKQTSILSDLSNIRSDLAEVNGAWGYYMLI